MTVTYVYSRAPAAAESSAASLISASDSMLTLPSYSPKVLQSCVRVYYVTGYYLFSAYVTFHFPLKSCRVFEWF